MTNPFGILSPFISPLLKLVEWIQKQRDLQESQKRLGMAIKDEAKVYMGTFEQLDKISEKTIELLDELENTVTKELINSIIVSSSDGLYVFGEIINSYVELSVAIKEFSTMETLMEKLKPNGFLYEFVCKIRDTVKDDNTLEIGGEYFRFILAYEDKIFKRIKKKDVEKANKLMEKYINLLKTKFQNAVIIMSNRRQFKKKYIKRVYISNVLFLAEARKRVNIDIPEDQVMEFIPEKFLPMALMFEEFSKIEYKPKRGHRQLFPKRTPPKRRRKQKKSKKR